MPHHIAFLRAVNVGKRQVKMADLREWLTEDGFTDVETYIQTGNVRVGSSLRSPAKVEARLEAVLRERCGFEVPCIMFTPAELRQVYDAALAIEPPPYAAAESSRYVAFFKQPPVVPDYESATERVYVVGRTVHIWIAGKMMDAPLFKTLAKPLEPGTNRSFNVLATLAEKWG